MIRQASRSPVHHHHLRSGAKGDWNSYHDVPIFPIHDDAGELSPYQGEYQKNADIVVIALDWAARLNVSHLVFWDTLHLVCAVSQHFASFCGSHY